MSDQGWEHVSFALALLADLGLGIVIGRIWAALRGWDER